MKFGDKLLELRKKNGLSQEELAEKLGVSRQSVSKWESNSTYPETDKIVQIANLFDCSMDDLINDKVVDVESTLRKNKNNFNEVWDSLLEFITKTVNMFSHMKFTSGLKCVIEMIILTFILCIMGNIICKLASTIIANIFTFLNPDIVSTIRELLTSIFFLIWFIISLIVIIHTFKIRYLNYYEEIEKVDSKKGSNNQKDEKHEIKTEKVIIRDEKDKPFAFLGVLSTIVMFFLKFIVFWIAFSTVFVLIGLAITSVISITFIPANLLFVGSSLALISSTVITVLFLLLCIYFIISKKINIKVFIITLISSIILLGVGIGICIISVKNFDVVKLNDNKDITIEELTIPYEDNLVIATHDLEDLNEFTFVADESISKDTILVDVGYDHNIKEIEKNKIEEDRLNLIMITGEFKDDFKGMYNLILEDLKDDKIVIDHLNSSINSLTIKANPEVIDKLIANTEKLYLLEKVTDGNTTKVKMHGDKVYIYGNGSFVEYNAITDELTYTEIAPEDYKCSRTIRKTEWGDRVEYHCLDSLEDIDFDED